MAPFVPYHVSAGSQKIVSFGGLLTTEFLEPPPGRGFCFRQTYRASVDATTDARMRAFIDGTLKPQGPPQHMHQYQAEYFQVEQGIMGLNLNGKLFKKTTNDPEFSVPAGSFHGFFRHPDSPGPMTVVLSASDSGNDYKLDRTFFENWYGYWHDALLYEGGMNYIQWLAIYDAGDAYPYVPAWVPFRRSVSYWWGVAIGRWLGGMLGYKPFYKEYTTDWDYAVSKMKASFFQRHLVHDTFVHEKLWEEQVKLSSGPCPTNAEHDAWTSSTQNPSNQFPLENGKVNSRVIINGNGHVA